MLPLRRMQTRLCSSSTFVWDSNRSWGIEKKLPLATVKIAKNDVWCWSGGGLRTHGLFVLKAITQVP
jgi:hypothetical protein